MSAQLQPGTADRGTTASLCIETAPQSPTSSSSIYIRNITRYSVSDDILNVGDPFSVTVPDSQHRLVSKIQEGARYNFFLSNPAIQGGVSALRQTGVVRSVSCQSSESGDVIDIRGADLGWHLQASGPAFYRLDGVLWRQVLEDLVTSNPSWGFKGVRGGNFINQRLKQDPRTEAQRSESPGLTKPLVVFQVEPGQKIGDVLAEYARREGVMINVSGDGWLQFFNPDYDQQISYVLHHHSAGSPDSVRNNCLSFEVQRNADKLYSEVTCVWDQLHKDIPPPVRADQPNYGRHQATWRRTEPKLQYERRLVFADPEPLSPEQGMVRAIWKAHREEFDSFVIVVNVAGHSQVGPDGKSRWWAAGSLCEIHSDIWGLDGVFYISSARLDGAKDGGNRTQLELHKTGLLSNEALKMRPNIPRTRKDPSVPRDRPNTVTEVVQCSDGNSL